jgi:hypothetical protein
MVEWVLFVRGERLRGGFQGRRPGRKEAAGKERGNRALCNDVRAGGRGLLVKVGEESEGKGALGKQAIRIQAM